MQIPQSISKILKRELKIEQAQSIQILADGALWIWNRVIPMLLELGVDKDRIIETLDYYHATEHLNDLQVYLENDKKNKIFTKLKESLWQGDISKMKRLIKKGIPDVDLRKFNPYQYFYKNRNQIDYQSLKE